MKRTVIIAVALSCICASANAQSILERLGQRAKDAVENKIGEKVEGAINSGIDKVIGKNQKGNAQSGSEAQYDNEQADPAVSSQVGWTCPECGRTGNTGAFCEDCGAKKPGAGPATAASATPAAPAPKKAATAYAKSDFVPGDEIIFDDDFANEQIGEFPSKWDLDGGNAEVATLDGRKVLMGLGYSAQVYPLMKNPRNYLSEAFTIEFDFYLGDRGEDAAGVTLRFYGPEESAGSWTMSVKDQFNWVLRKPTDGETSGNKWWDEADKEGLIMYNDWNHIAISFNKRAFKAYINGTRITSVPNMAAPKYVIFEIAPSEKTEYNGISNVRIANGAVPLYDRLATDGKIITYAITFETGKADIKPESYVEINRIAKLMQENPNLCFEVQGHCDASGSDKVNDPLSQKRAEAIVAALVEQGIAQARLTAVGKGSHSPIADNSTDEGRAKNRRVEFVKK